MTTRNCRQPANPALWAALLLCAACSPTRSVGISRWKQIPCGTTADLTGVWGADDDHVFAVGKNGTFLWISHGQCTRIPGAPAEDLNAVAVRSRDRIVVAGRSGALAWFSGWKWQPFHVGLPARPHWVAVALGPQGELALGGRGAFAFEGAPREAYLYDQETPVFTSVLIDHQRRFLAARPGEGYCTVVHCNIDTMLTEPCYQAHESMHAHCLYSIWGGADGAMLAVGRHTYHQGHPRPEHSALFLTYPPGPDYRSSLWQEVPPPDEGTLRSVHSNGNGQAYAVGDRGMVLRYDGVGLHVETPPTRLDLTGVWMGQDRLFVVGQDGLVLEGTLP